MFIGKDGFIWWMGVVEDIADPLTLGRCKVRIFGYHPEASLGRITKDELPWATVIHPANTPNLYATPRPGEWVFGFFLDSQEAKEPAILGYLPANPTTTDANFGSVGSPVYSTLNNRRVIRNFNRASQSQNANKSVIWEYGDHLIELVEGGSIYIQHKSGSYINMSTNGDVKIYCDNDLAIEANNNITLAAKKGSIVAIANVNFSTTANNNILYTSGNNISMEANSNFTISSNNATMTVRNAIGVASNNITATSNTGNFSIGSVTFSSAEITLNSSNNISIDAGGTLTLDGTIINLG